MYFVLSGTQPETKDEHGQSGQRETAESGFGDPRCTDPGDARQSAVHLSITKPTWSTKGLKAVHLWTVMTVLYR